MAHFVKKTRITLKKKLITTWQIAAGSIDNITGNFYPMEDSFRQCKIKKVRTDQVLVPAHYENKPVFKVICDGEIQAHVLSPSRWVPDEEEMTANDIQKAADSLQNELLDHYLTRVKSVKIRKIVKEKL